MSFNDLEQGRSVPGATDEPRELHSDSPEFIHLTDQVGLHVFRINANIATLQNLTERLRRTDAPNQKASDELMRQFTDLCDQTRSIVRDATRDVKALSLYPVSSYGSTPARLLQTKLQRDFQHALSNFQRIQKAGIRKERVALEEAKRRGAVNATETALQLSEQKQRPESEEQAQVQVPRISQAELEFQEALISEREAEIREIENGVQELNEIFRDLSHIVQEQGGMIDNIEYNITHISTNAQGSDRELLRAHTYQRRAGRRTLCLMLIIAFVIAVVLLALLG